MDHGLPPSTGPGPGPRRDATFAEKQSGGGSLTPPGPLLPHEEAAQLGAEWRMFARIATGVAILTAPVLFLVLYRVLGWGLAASILLTVLGVAAFRGLVDVVTRRFIPRPSGFGDASVRAADISATRAAWFWRFWFRAVLWVAGLYAIAVAIVYVVDAIQGDADFGDALRAPLDAIQEQFATSDSRLQIVGFAITIALLFVVNTIIFLGPLLYAGIKQIQRFEPGDAKWGVTFDDIRGQDVPKDEVRKIVSLWQASDAFERAGGRPERGVLFMGAPGTGKTMMAKAVATGFNSPFVALPGSALSQTFIGVDVILVKWLTWRARRLARKWGGRCLIFIDEIDAIGRRRVDVASTTARSIHDMRFHGPMGALTPSGDLILESEPWRERLFRERAPGGAGTLYPAPLQRAADRVREFVMPGMGGVGQGGLQQLLVEMDGVTGAPGMPRFLANRLNTFLDALYVIPTHVGRVRLRIPPLGPRREQVFYIGACNVPLASLDPALTRAGRMGRQIVFRTPDAADRQDIIDLYLGKVAHDPALDEPHRREELARITMGHSPAMIQQVASLALSYAHERGAVALEWQDLLDAVVVVEYGLPSGFRFIPDEARAIAVHEAGHAVTGHAFMKDHMSTRLSITPRGASAGHHAMREVDERFARWQHEVFAELVWTLGAMAAERVFYGENGQGVGGDLAAATSSAAMMVGVWGMAPQRPDLRARFATDVDAEIAERKLMRRFEQVGTRIVNRTSTPEADEAAAVLADPAKRAMVAQFLGQAFMTAYWFVRENRAATERVADALVQRRDLFGDEVTSLLSGLDLHRPDVDPFDEANWPQI